ncbi:Pendrin, putative [Pediculus humanus corporis]|uniref:Pendrin, putative n=1 Tax=Pediculus humanus subsp. corporis TaxID=121224 RepID=E0VIM7_PEDHC|nr:Pendrin, putative [Pediculus humanus corporis]EEB13233.1 Pendrin, putative [Pediculus humanus corporis]
MQNEEETSSKDDDEELLLLTEEKFREKYNYEEMKKVTFKKKFKRNLKCNKEKILNFIPICRWLPKYNPKKDLGYDIIAGITTAVMHIPHGLSYAPLARVDPIIGLYMAIFPVFVYMIFGTSRILSIGTFAVLCTMVGDVVNSHQANYQSLIDKAYATNNTLIVQHNYTSLEVGTAVCLLVGFWQCLLGFLRLGVFMVVMSKSMVSGFTTGAAICVFSYQLKSIFGIHVQTFTGALKLVYFYIDFFSKIKTTNCVTLGTSLSAIALLLFFNEYLKPLIKKKHPKNRIPVPIELFVLVIGILTSYMLDLKKNYNVEIVGYIPQGMPVAQMPPLSLLPHVITESFMVALVALSINLSLTKIFESKSDYVIDDNQELIAYGFSNIASSFFLCLPSAASLSRTTIQYSTGGKTQLASFFSAVLMILTIIFVQFLFEPVPYCILGSIVVVTLKGLLLQVLDLPKIIKENLMDGIIWIGTFFAVILIDIDIGLGVGILLSVVSLAFSSSVLKVNVIGQVPQSNIYLNMEFYKSATSIPYILILKIEGNVTFANCSNLEKKILREYKNFFAFSIEDDSNVILDLSSMNTIDPTGVKIFIELYQYFSKLNTKLYITHCNNRVYRVLHKCKFFTIFPKEQVAASVNDVVIYLNSKK